jgi:hypothetical protein
MQTRLDGIVGVGDAETVRQTSLVVEAACRNKSIGVTSC